MRLLGLFVGENVSTYAKFKYMDSNID